MIEINLLNWRDELKKRNQKDFIARGVASIAIALIVVGLSYQYNSDLIGKQNLRNDLLDAEIKNLDKKLGELKEIEDKKTSLLKKMDVIYELKVSRPMSVHLFDELSNTVPNGVYLTSLKQSENKIEIEGAAESNSRVSAYMTAIDNSLWVSKSDLIFVENKGAGKDDNLNKFSLFATVVNKNNNGAIK